MAVLHMGHAAEVLLQSAEARHHLPGHTQVQFQHANLRQAAEPGGATSSGISADLIR